MRRRIMAVLLAVLLALVGSSAVVAYVRKADERAIAGQQAVQVLVAVKRIPAGTTGARVRAGRYLARITVPAATVPNDALDELDPALDALATTADVQPSQLVLRGMFGEPTAQTGGLAVPEGKLAVSVEMTAAARVAGFVRAGSKVVVFDTYTMREGSRTPSGDGLTAKPDANHVTRVLLPRVDVIAVGERGTAGADTGTPAGTAGDDSGKESGGAKGGVSMLITVAVSQDEAERLVHAAQTGTLYLALLDDTATIEPGPGVDNTSLFPG